LSVERIDAFRDALLAGTTTPSDDGSEDQILMDGIDSGVDPEAAHGSV
jgi:hypothetical protein